jgi:hypothetical protein
MRRQPDQNLSMVAILQVLRSMEHVIREMRGQREQYLLATVVIFHLRYSIQYLLKHSLSILFRKVRGHRDQLQRTLSATLKLGCDPNKFQEYGFSFIFRQMGEQRH